MKRRGFLTCVQTFAAGTHRAIAGELLSIEHEAVRAFPEHFRACDAATRETHRRLLLAAQRATDSAPSPHLWGVE